MGENLGAQFEIHPALSQIAHREARRWEERAQLGQWSVEALWHEYVKDELKKNEKTRVTYRGKRHIGNGSVAYGYGRNWVSERKNHLGAWVRVAYGGVDGGKYTQRLQLTARHAHVDHVPHRWQADAQQTRVRCAGCGAVRFGVGGEGRGAVAVEWVEDEEVERQEGEQRAPRYPSQAARHARGADRTPSIINSVGRRLWTVGALKAEGHNESIDRVAYAETGIADALSAPAARE